MSSKVPIWEYLDEDFGEINQDEGIGNNSEQYNTKRMKKLDKNSGNQESIWLKSLLNPSIENEFIEIGIESLITVSKNHVIVNIKPDKLLFPEFTSLIGFFNCWWWRNVLSKAEFLTVQELSNSFPFLKRIMGNDILIDETKNFYLLLNNPKTIADDTNSKKGLVTCKRFLIINKD